MTAPVNISVLVPVYNVEPYLAQCLESICSQTLRELEVVCVDDASTDGSLSILRGIRGAGPAGESGAGPGKRRFIPFPESGDEPCCGRVSVSGGFRRLAGDGFAGGDVPPCEGAGCRQAGMRVPVLLRVRPPTGRTGFCRRTWPLRKKGGFPALRRPLGKYIMERAA